MSEELKPCPFCGGRAEFEHRQFEDNHWAPRDFWNVRVQCTNCDVKKSWYQYGEMEQRTVSDETKKEAEQEAAVGWNSRSDTSQARLSEAVKVLEEASEHIETLSELLKVIKESWIDYDHVFSIAVHEADKWVEEKAKPLLANE